MHPSIEDAGSMAHKKARLPFRLFSAALVTVIFGTFLPCCSDGGAARTNPEDGPTPFESYMGIPGVTDEEISAIFALRERYRDSVLIYGMIHSIEAFSGRDSAVSGYAAMVSRYMSDLFGLNIRPAIYEWGDLLAGLKSGEVSLSGDMTPSETRRQTGYYMTRMPIATRSIVYFQLDPSEPLAKIKRTRTPRYGFLDGTTTINAVMSTLLYMVDTIHLHNYEDAYAMLQSGQIDAFFDESSAEAAFSVHNDIVKHTYLPLIYEPASLTTQQPEFLPVISVMDKLLQGGGLQYLNHLYDLGEQEYQLYNMYSKLTGEERAYINRRPVVRLAIEYDNYPVSFYNENEKAWQGIALEMLREVERLTGITFKISNDVATEFETLASQLEKGHVSVITELIRTSERDQRFLWPHTPTMESRYALISTADQRNIKINEILGKRVGAHKGTAYAEQFRNWFPDHPNIVEYASTIEMFDALERGEIDLAMSSQAMILAVTNYMERPGYKINVLFDHIYESLLGFNRDEALLCSIVDKALQLVDIEKITERWMHKTYDYRVKLAQSRYPFFISVSVLLLCVIILLLVLFRKNSTMEKKLQALVGERTAELKKQNNLMEAVAKNYKGVIWSINKDGVIMMFEGRYLKTLGVEPSFLVGKNIEIARQKGRHLDIINNVEKTLRGETRSWMSDIDGGTFHSNTVPIYDANGEIAGVTGSTDDITEMVRLSHDLEIALEDAKAASRAKSAFLANMSHEIRTPMNSVIGFSELALDYDMPEKPKEYIVKILDNSKWLLQIINDILDISKIEAGKMTLESIPFDLHEIFVLCRTATIPKALEKGLILHFYAEPFVGKRLIGDPTRLRQVFINLISNAVKFTNIGTVKVSAEVTETGDDTVSVRFEVRDSGIGMTPEEMKKVLEPFAQADYSTTRKYGGTGLGLSIIRSFVELMGGKLTVNSTPGVGSKFSFDLSFKTVDIPPEGTEITSGISDEEDVERPMFDAEVLVCEDNSMNQEVIRRHLERIGLRATIADNGKAGVEFVKHRMEEGKKLFDLIFMDINMPVMDGLEASARIMELGTGIPIVAMTANVMSSDRELYDKSGMHDCVGKPFTSQELWHCLLRHLKPVESAKREPEQRDDDDDLLTELQTIFVNSNQQKFAEFFDAVNNSNIKLAHRIVHTLKSNAGTIGKPALQKAATAAENMLADGNNSLTKEHIETLETELNAVLRELAPLLKKSAGGAPASGSANAGANVSDFADELNSLLQKGNPDSLKFIERLRSISGSEELIRQMEDFDFDSAAETFAALIKISGEIKT